MIKDDKWDYYYYISGLIKAVISQHRVAQMTCQIQESLQLDMNSIISNVPQVGRRNSIISNIPQVGRRNIIISNVPKVGRSNNIISILFQYNFELVVAADHRDLLRPGTDCHYRRNFYKLISKLLHDWIN